MKVKLVNVPLTFHLSGTEVREVAPCKERGKPLPRTLVMPPGTYRVHGKDHPLTREGLYRFCFPAKQNQQRIVFAKDVAALLSSLSWISTHGSLDNRTSQKELRRHALTRKLVITCGTIAQFGHEVLAGLGLCSRTVGSATLGQLNTYDNGHALLEVCLNGKWVLVDLDANKMFRRRGKRLSLLEFSEAVAADDYEFERLSLATPIAISGFTEEGYDYAFWMETALPSDAAWRKWYRRIMMVPFISDDGIPYFTVNTPAKRKRADLCYADRKLQYLPRDEFVRKFYGPAK